MADRTPRPRTLLSQDTHAAILFAACVRLVIAAVLFSLTAGFVFLEEGRSEDALRLDVQIAPVESTSSGR